MKDELAREPVAYLYENEEGSRELVFDCNSEYARRLLEFGYTETPLAALTPPEAEAEDALEEAFEQARALIQEAKGADGPNGGFVTDHLDCAEHWLNKAEALALRRSASPSDGPTSEGREG